MDKKMENIVNTEIVQFIASLPAEVAIFFYETEQGILYETISNGSNLDVAMPNSKDIIEKAELLNSKRIMLMHNHPPVNGNISTNPSPDDIGITILLRDHLKNAGITLVDHIVVSANGYYSMKAAGII